MDELVVQPEALIQRAKRWEDAAEWLRDSEREIAGVPLSAVGESVRPAAGRFWAAAQVRTQVGVRSADGLAEALRGVVADVDEADRRAADGLGSRMVPSHVASTTAPRRSP